MIKAQVTLSALVTYCQVWDHQCGDHAHVCCHSLTLERWLL